MGVWDSMGDVMFPTSLRTGQCVGVWNSMGDLMFPTSLHTGQCVCVGQYG